jgi:hypothetical protein
MSELRMGGNNFSLRDLRSASLRPCHRSLRRSRAFQIGPSKPVRYMQGCDGRALGNGTAEATGHRASPSAHRAATSRVWQPSSPPLPQRPIYLSGTLAGGLTMNSDAAPMPPTPRPSRPHITDEGCGADDAGWPVCRIASATLCGTRNAGRRSWLTRLSSPMGACPRSWRTERPVLDVRQQ